jgi:D-arabinose 1-dehydrogenase-like Zn-dependent alcohol dehydrogenase
MMCGGITLYSPLKHYGCGPGKKVGVVGIGGLGHFGILFAKAMGADKVVAISRKANKKEDALKLGADEYIATDDEPDWAQRYNRSLDLIVSTVSSSKVCTITPYVWLVRLYLTFIRCPLCNTALFSAPTVPSSRWVLPRTVLSRSLRSP